MAERALGPGRRFALVVTTDEYEDERLARFAGEPRRPSLPGVLEHPDIGAFQTFAVANGTTEDIRRGLELSLEQLEEGDLFVLYLSGLAYVTMDDRFLFAARDTIGAEPLPTTISSEAVRMALDACRARSVAVFLDATILPDEAVVSIPAYTPPPQRLAGPNRVVITATRPAGAAVGESLGEAMTEGLGSGEADMNGDGLVDLDELFVYLTRRLGETGAMPERSEVNVREQVIIARNPHAGERRLPDRDEPTPERFDAAPVATSDFWTIRDELGYADYAEAIAAFIQHDDTRPPLTIGIKAPWGAGKTSLMRMVQQELDPAWQGERAEIRLTSRSKRRLGTDGTEQLEPVTVGTVLKEVEDPDAPGTLRAEPEQTAQLVDPGDWRPTVWFNPWMYQSGEQVWAGFAHEVIAQITGRMPPLERQHFWLALNKARVDQDAVRRKVYTLVFQRLVPALLSLLALIVVAAVALAVDAVVGFSGEIADALTGVLGTGGIGAVVWGAVRSAGVRAESATGAFDRLVREPTYDVKLGDVIDDPGYEQRLGFLYLVQTDIRRVLDLVATERQPLVVFVDDLDRCSPGTVAQVIEAINLFLAGEFPNCIFVLAMEPEVVAAHIEVAHEPLVKMLKERGLDEGAGTLGWRFLEKIVQLPLNLPPPGGARVGTFLGAFLAAGEPPPGPVPVEQAASAAPPDMMHLAQTSRTTAEMIDAAASALSQAPTTAAPPPPRPDPERVERRAARQELGRRLRHDSPEVLAIVKAVAGHLGGNPREIKRFVNVFRFYAFIQQERERSRPSERVELLQVAKLALLAIRWPHLRGVLGGPVRTGEEVTVLAQLVTCLHAENGGQPPPSLDQQLTDAGVRETVRRTLVADQSLCAFLREQPRLEASVASLL